MMSCADKLAWVRSMSNPFFRKKALWISKPALDIEQAIVFEKKGRIGIAISNRLW
jgi:hypothetical protein